VLVAVVRAVVPPRVITVDAVTAAVAGAITPTRLKTSPSTVMTANFFAFLLLMKLPSQINF
jgi:predicted tellurium resistance membrane protein TerC